jgi:hypothetical protein
MGAGKRGYMSSCLPTRASSCDAGSFHGHTRAQNFMRPRGASNWWPWLPRAEDASIPKRGGLNPFHKLSQGCARWSTLSDSEGSASHSGTKCQSEARCGRLVMRPTFYLSACRGTCKPVNMRNGLFSHLLQEADEQATLVLAVMLVVAPPQPKLSHESRLLAGEKMHRTDVLPNGPAKARPKFHGVHLAIAGVTFQATGPRRFRRQGSPCRRLTHNRRPQVCPEASSPWTDPRTVAHRCWKNCYGWPHERGN